MGDDLATDGVVPEPGDITGRPFNTAFRGFDQAEVRGYLATLASQLTQLRERERAALARVADLEAATSSRPVGEDELEVALGVETTRVLHAAREAGAEIRARAEESVARLLREANDQVAAMRAEAESLLHRRTEEADTQAGAIVEEAQQRGRDMVAEAQAVRDRVLKDVARRRRAAEAELEALIAGRGRMMSALEAAGAAAAHAVAALAAVQVDELPEPAGAQPPSAALAAVQVDELPEPAGAQPPSAAVDAPVVAPPAGQPAPVVEAATGAGEVEADHDEPVDPAEPVADPPAPSSPPPAMPVDDPPSDVSLSQPLPPVAPAPPLPAGPAVVPPEERRSSSLRLLRRRPEPFDEPFDDNDVEGVRIIRPARPNLSAVPEGGAVDPVPTPENEDGSVPVGEADDPVSGDDESARPVDDLFARLRADRAAAVADAVEVLARPIEDPPVEPHAADVGPAPEVAPVAEVGPVAGPVAEIGEIAAPADAAFERRDREVDDVERGLIRSIKRALTDEQNEVLDALRRHRGRPNADALLPDPAVHQARYSAVGADAMAAGAAAGAAVHDGAPADTRGLADRLGDDIATDLRNRVARAVEGGADDAEALVEAISAGYREWKTSRVEAFAHHHVAAAYALGCYEAAPAGLLIWRVDPAEGGCPDCDDNALAGPTPKGAAYPTGQTHPPAHAGCRCLLLPSQ